MYYLNTKDQAELLLKNWGTYRLPKKNDTLVIFLPEWCQDRVCEVTVHTHKSTYGQPLYRLEFMSLEDYEKNKC